jgi:glutamate formiminotransferase
VHPRLGALDVVPFVWLAPSQRDSAVARAGAFARWWADAFAVPVFLYGAADGAARDLPALRRDAFGTRGPDAGPPAAHPRLGATAVGARAPLVAVNCELGTADLSVSRAIAGRVRERDGGLPGVRALGFALDRAGCAQVSMNLTDLARTGIEAACGAVRDAARAAGTDVTRVELVGLMPEAELARCSPAFRAWSGLTRAVTIEGRLAARG